VLVSGQGEIGLARRHTCVPDNYDQNTPFRSVWEIPRYAEAVPARVLSLVNTKLIRKGATKASGVLYLYVATVLPGRASWR